MDSNLNNNSDKDNKKIDTQPEEELHEVEDLGEVTADQGKLVHSQSRPPAASANPSSPQDLISLALNNNADVETLSKLMDLQERWEQNIAKKEFLKALTKFQSIVPDIPKTKHVSFDSSRGGKVDYWYAPLDKVIKIIQPYLKKCGLSYRFQFETTDKGKTKCTCLLSHAAGFTDDSSSMEADPDTSGVKNAIQSQGSTRSYLQRYTLYGALGLSTGEDDSDGRAPDGTQVLKTQLLEEIIQLQKDGKLDPEKANLRTKYVKLGLDKKLVTDIIYDSIPVTDEVKELYNETLINIQDFTDVKELEEKWKVIYETVKKKLPKTMLSDIETAFQKQYDKLTGKRG